MQNGFGYMHKETQSLHLGCLRSWGQEWFLHLFLVNFKMTLVLRQLSEWGCLTDGQEASCWILSLNREGLFFQTMRPLVRLAGLLPTPAHTLFLAIIMKCRFLMHPV